MSLEALFWAKVWRCTHRDCKRCCWPWKPSLARALAIQAHPFFVLRHPQACFVEHGRWTSPDTTSAPAHRWAVTFDRGALVLPFAFPLHVCHRCDFPPCCNPRHLFVGTHQDNMHDMHLKWETQAHAVIVLPNGNTMTRWQRFTAAFLEGVGVLPRARNSLSPEQEQRFTEVVSSMRHQGVSP